MSGPLSIVDLLRKKRDGEELSSEEIHWFIQEVVNGRAEDCQIGAMLMAIYLKGLSDQETVDLTIAMVESGKRLQWDPKWKDLLVDKHSTGGCGDKISLILAPALAACGFKVPMVSGRGLEYTGGTLDKLESIPGFQVQLSDEQMQNALEKAGCFIAGPTSSLAPGDKELYKRRDVTATVNNTSLIVASIISKKVAEGTKTLVMDIKVGSAAFYKTLPEARVLASKLIRVSAVLGVQTSVALTRMDTPIGHYVGNALEVAEAVECLKGKGPKDLVELVTTLGGLVLKMKNKVKTIDEGKDEILKTINSGEALERFKQMLICQGVDEKTAIALCEKDVYRTLPCVSSDKISVIKASKAGIVTKIDALSVAKASWYLGAGRSKAEQSIDHKVGIKLLCVEGDKINQGDAMLEIHYNSENLDKKICQDLEEAIVITKRSDGSASSPIIEIITE